MSVKQAQEIFLPRRGKRVSSNKSTQVARSTVADTWHWLWPDVLMRIIPLGVIPFLYIALLHLPLAFLGLTLHNWPQQLVLGLVIGIGMTVFSTLYRMLIVGPWFRWPTLSDHALQGSFYLFVNGPVEELFFSWFSAGSGNAIDRLDRLGLAGQHCCLHALPSTGEMELAQCWRGWTGRAGFQFSVPGTTRAAIATGGGDCAWSHHLGLSEPG